jgi:hypothetical protein
MQLCDLKISLIPTLLPEGEGQERIRKESGKNQERKD